MMFRILTFKTLPLKSLAKPALIATTFAFVVEGSARADQLCNTNADGTTYGCMNITWDCGTFTVNDGQVCVSSIAAPSGEIKKDIGHAGGSYEIGDFEADIADTLEKKGLVNGASETGNASGEQKAAGCPPICLQKPVIVTPPVEPD
jgi:hypothetical protein